MVICAHLNFRMKATFSRVVLNIYITVNILHTCVDIIFIRSHCDTVHIREQVLLTVTLMIRSFSPGTIS